MELPRFVVSCQPVHGLPLPVVGVDGPVHWADVLYDHHATGEAVNLETLPFAPVTPATLVTTMLDGDAVISAAVLLLRCAGEHAAVERAWPVLYEAAHYCDHLVPSGRHGETIARAGLGLHCWLKQRGGAERRSVRDSSDRTTGHVELREAGESAVSRAFRTLTLELIAAICASALPCDFSYLRQIDEMQDAVRGWCRDVQGKVTMLWPRGYADPLAIYREVTTDHVLLVMSTANGYTHYKLGVHPRAYTRVDLRPVFGRLHALEPGWGGRANAGGSPLTRGSTLCLDDVLACIAAGAY